MDGARLRAEALKIETEAELERMTAAREADIKFSTEQNKLDLEKAQVNISFIIFSVGGRVIEQNNYCGEIYLFPILL